MSNNEESSCLIKVAHLTRQDAEYALRQMKNCDRCVVYKCKYCCYYHVGRLYKTDEESD